jgi:hypothetical protein
VGAFLAICLGLKPVHGGTRSAGYQHKQRITNSKPPRDRINKDKLEGQS